MKFNIICSILILLLASTYSHNLLEEAHNKTDNNQKSGYKTFLVKTKLAKEELEALLQEGETQLVNLKKNKNKTHKPVIEEIKNTTNITHLISKSLEKRIEQEIKADALNPLHEFLVNQSEVQTLVTTQPKKTRFIDALYEKRFGKFYAYLTLFLFIFVMFYYKDIIFGQKKMKSKNPYANNFDYFNEKEYMLVKNN